MFVDHPLCLRPLFLLCCLASILAWAAVAGGQETAPEHDQHEGQQKGHHSHEHPTHGEGDCGHHELHHDFSDAEQWAARFDSPDRDAWQKPAEVVALMEIAPGMTAVDLGAGTGYFLGHLSQAVGESGQVWALDPEPNLIQFMSERAAREGWGNVTPRRIPFDDPELAAGTVDRVLTVNTWHHIEDRPAYAAKLLASLAPGGRVYVVDYTLDSPSGPPKEHRLAPEQVIAELAAGGFAAAVVEESLPRQYIVVGRRPE